MRLRRLIPVLALALMTALPLIGVPAVAPALAGPGGDLRPPPTLTGILEFRVFIQDCRCYPWAIDKNGRVWEVDVRRVQDEADALIGQRVKATGRWSTYQRDGQTIRFLRVTGLGPA